MATFTTLLIPARSIINKTIYIKSQTKNRETFDDDIFPRGEYYFVLPDSRRFKIISRVKVAPPQIRVPGPSPVVYLAVAPSYI